MLNRILVSGRLELLSVICLHIKCIMAHNRISRSDKNGESRVEFLIPDKARPNGSKLSAFTFTGIFVGYGGLKSHLYEVYAKKSQRLISAAIREVIFASELWEDGAAADKESLSK